MERFSNYSTYPVDRSLFGILGRWVLTGLVCFLGGLTQVKAQVPPFNPQASASRKIINLNEGWRSIAGNDDQPIAAAFQAQVDDRKWKSVTVPHNWDDYYGYRRLLHGNKHGDAWYRKKITIKEPGAGKRFFLFFEGVGSYATIYLNEVKVGAHAGGRTSFTIDVTDVLKTDGSANILAVRAWHPPFIKDLPWVCGGCSEERGFSEGSQPMGIFRPVSLVVTNEIRITPFGVHAWASITPEQALLHSDITVRNYGTNTGRDLTVIQELLDRNRQVVAKATKRYALKGGDSMVLSNKNVVVPAPILWSPENPYLYTIKTTLRVQNEVLDVVETDFGFRKVQWNTASNQFLVNGKPVFINGVAEYEHLLGQSHAFSHEQIVARVKWLQAAGFNAFRDAHQPHNLLYGKLFNERGILWWTQLSAHVWYDTPAFKENFKKLLQEWVIERRNDPSVVMWGLQNESKIPEGFARECTELIRSLDPTSRTQRLVTTCNGGVGTDWDVPQNWTGTYGGDPNTYGQDLKKQVLVGEYGAWRTLDLHTAGGFEQNGVVSEDRFTQLMQTKIRLGESVKDSVAGHFFWLLTSHDNPGRVQGGEGLRELDRIGPVNYKGLLTPWEEPTDAFYMFRSHYVAAATSPMVYIASHSWPNRWAQAGIKDSIMVYSNCEEVELFNDIDAASLGRRQTRGFGTHFIWNQVPIRYNVLYAVGYVNGRPVARDTILLHHLEQAPGLRKNDPQGIDLLEPQPDYHYIYRLNCGGGRYTDHRGNIWSADKPLPAGGQQGFFGSSSWTNTFSEMPSFFASQRRNNAIISHTSDEALFRDFRYGRDQLHFRFPVPNGRYSVELYFAEPWLGVGGGMDARSMRVFDVAINRKTVLDDFDIWKETGVHAALKKTFSVEVRNGVIDVSFPQVKVGQAVIAAIAVASRREIQPAPSASWINNLKCEGCEVESWLDEGATSFEQEAIEWNRLSPLVFGADWVRFKRASNNPIEFTLTDTADVYLGISQGGAVPNQFEDLNDQVVTDEASGNQYALYRKRLPKGALVRVMPAQMGLVAVMPASHMQPAYDLKPTHSYKANVATFTKNVQKAVFSGSERTVVIGEGPAGITWPIETGVADVYAITVKYYSHLKKDVDAVLELFDVSQKRLVQVPVKLKFTRPGKWNYATINTGTMINAGAYQVKLITSDAKGLVVSNIDVQ